MVIGVAGSVAVGRVGTLWARVDAEVDGSGGACAGVAGRGGEVDV